jgi:hypothetical protein
LLALCNPLLHPLSGILDKRRAGGKSEKRRPEIPSAKLLMLDPDRLLNTLHRAIGAFRDTAGRCGRLVRLQSADDVLVAGDLHGNLENFRQLLLRADLAHHPQRHLVLQELIHGPFRYPTGGDKSHQLLDLLAALKCQYPDRVHMLLGNHELAQWTVQAIAKANLDLNDLFRTGVDAAYAGRAAEVYAAYLELFAVVPLGVRTNNRVFLSHSVPGASRLATFDPAVLECDVAEAAQLAPGGSVHALVWGRDTRAETVKAFLQKMDADYVITGHIPCEAGFEVPNDRQIILDALGASAGYCLFPARAPVTHQELVACIKLL